jgi:uncharacterized protein YutE (UPF0331/DUF86 family)
MKMLDHVERVLNKRDGVDEPATYRKICQAMEEIEMLPHERYALLAALHRHGVIA